MVHEKKKQLKLSYESDGVMGEDEKAAAKNKSKQDAEFNEEFFFNTTQNSE